eukprot:TRINITY_DN7951_c0_g1_i1.p1 TRINITY_DN7951_c0_g1~~TRINITY_DN7951_c0_g1_i1.p1  ORF type:complete len:114 (+),score=20.75 TRINITY_DN7951_c0_g1_i1:82-423(+)
MDMLPGLNESLAAAAAGGISGPPPPPVPIAAEKGDSGRKGGGAEKKPKSARRGSGPAQRPLVPALTALTAFGPQPTRAPSHASAAHHSHAAHTGTWKDKALATLSDTKTGAKH